MKKVLTHFNNLSKRLTYNIYFIANIKEEDNRNKFIFRMNTTFNAENLSRFSCELARILEAEVLNISYFDYYPFGASANSLICNVCENNNQSMYSECVSIHLDKSHISIHTYPEKIDDDDIVTFRIDVELSTCGEILPLTAIDFVINYFKADFYTVEYSTRGYTRDENGKKIFVDEKLKPLVEYLNENTKMVYKIFSKVAKKKDYACMICAKKIEFIHNNVNYTDLDNVEYSKEKILREIKELEDAHDV